MKTAGLVRRQGCKYRYILFFSKSKYPLDLPASVLTLPPGHWAVRSHQPLPFPFRAPTMHAALPVRQAGLAKSLTIQSFRSPKSQILLKA
jgi:hypothetical protein